MSDHEFEKQVHQKLEELKLRPSDTVWMEVEKNIRNNKRRRGIAWWWMAALLAGLTVSGYMLYRYTVQTNNTTGVAQATTASLSNTKSAETSTNSTQPTTTENTNSNTLSQTGKQQPPVQAPVAAAETAPPVAASNNKQPVTTTVEKNTVQHTTINKIKKPVQQPLAYNSENTSPDEGINTSKLTHKKSRYRKNNTIEDPIVINSTPCLASPHKEDEELNSIRLVQLDRADSAIATAKAATTPFNAVVPPMTALQGKISCPDIPRWKASLWHYGFVAGAGYSRISTSKLFQLKGLLGTQKFVAEDLASRSLNSVAPSTGNSAALINVGTVTATKKASPIQPDFSWSAGFFVERTISPRLKVSLGLEYAYMSVNTEVGKKYDSTIAVNIGTTSVKLVDHYYESPGYIDIVRGGTYANFQSAGTGRAYYSQKQRYRFHYIEIPLLLNWQINKGRRLPPFHFEGGFSIARMISVDALHYEGIKGVYYEDNSLFNKTQFNFVTGLSVGLLQRSKHPLWIGPNLRYALNGLVKKEVSTGQYLWSAGVSVKMSLGRL